MVILVVTLQSCNQNPSLQSYYVDSAPSPGFTSFDVPASTINIEGLDLTKEQLEAYESIEKLNLLTFMKSASNQEDYEVEMAKVKTILKDPKYEELMRGGNSTDGKFVVKCIGGDGNDVDEFILFGNANEQGFALVRVIGDNMNFGKIMELASVLQDANVDQGQLEELTKFFK